MTKRLDAALDVVRRMPAADQDIIANAMLSMAQVDEGGALDQDELRDALEGLAEIDRGDVASEEQTEAAFRRFRP